MINVPKVKKGMKIEDIYNKETKFTTEAFSEKEILSLKLGDVV